MSTLMTPAALAELYENVKRRFSWLDPQPSKPETFTLPLDAAVAANMVHPRPAPGPTAEMSETAAIYRERAAVDAAAEAEVVAELPAELRERLFSAVAELRQAERQHARALQALLTHQRQRPAEHAAIAGWIVELDARKAAADAAASEVDAADSIFQRVGWAALTALRERTAGAHAAAERALIDAEAEAAALREQARRVRRVALVRRDALARLAERVERGDLAIFRPDEERGDAH